MTSQIQERVKGQRNTRRKRVFMITGFLAAMILVAAAAAFYGLGFDNKNEKVMSLSSPHEKINILVLGIDKRRDDIGRSNVTCVVTVDPDTRKVSLLWVPRDSRVKIPGNGWNKIGHAYAYGGPALAEQTVANLLGIPIHYYFEVNMDGFKKVIDALGGVDINVDKRMYYYDPYDEGEVDNNGLIDIHPGLQHMDGNTALEYVRFRHDEMGDIGRIERQQKFIKALLADVVTPSVITKVPGAIREVNRAFKTDMPVGEMLSLAKILNDAYKQGLKTEMVQGKPVYIDNISYWIPDIVAMRKQVAQIQGTVMDAQYLAAAQSLAREYETSLFQAKLTEAPTVAESKPEHPDKHSVPATTKTTATEPANTKKTPVATNKTAPLTTKPSPDGSKNGNEPRLPPLPALTGSGNDGVVQKNTAVDTSGNQG
ncbi:LCP family protein [Lucifera butyrica]|nr:LCP family protein [Lucifera butyrica]